MGVIVILLSFQIVLFLYFLVIHSRCYSYTTIFPDVRSLKYVIFCIGEMCSGIWQCELVAMCHIILCHVWNHVLAVIFSAVKGNHNIMLKSAVLDPPAPHNHLVHLQPSLDWGVVPHFIICPIQSLTTAPFIMLRVWMITKSNHRTSCSEVEVIRLTAFSPVECQSPLAVRNGDFIS